MDYYGAVFLTHLAYLSQNLQPRVGMELHYDNGFQAHLIQGLPKDLARPRFVRTQNTKDLRAIAEQLAARGAHPEEGAKEIQVFTSRIQPFSTLSSLAEKNLTQHKSLFELLDTLETNFSKGNVNSVWGEGGAANRKLLFHAMGSHFTDNSMPANWLNSTVTIPKTALTWWNWTQTPEVDCCSQEIQRATLRATLQPPSHPVTYRILQYQDLNFWGKEVSPVSAGKTHPDTREFPDPTFRHEFEGGDFTIHLNVHDALHIPTLLESFSRQQSFPTMLRCLHHLIHSFKYCEVKGDKLLLTDKGLAVATSLTPFHDHLSSEAHQAMEQDLESIRKGQRDRTHFLHRWYNYFRGTYDEVYTTAQ
jgi:hypothetical protein